MRWLMFLLLLLLSASQAALWSVRGGIPKVLELRSRIAMQLKENAELRDRNAALDAEVRDLKNGLAAVEERARSEMGMIKQGEMFYQLVDVPRLPRASAGTDRLTADARE